MPGPKAALMKQTTKATFKAQSIMIPIDWQQPVGDPEGSQYIEAFKMTELAVPFSPTMLFIPSTPNKYHVDSTKKVHNQFDKYIDGICDAICFAWDQWRLQAKFSNLMIAAVSAIGAPGCLKGPKLESMIKMKGPKATKAEFDYTKAVAKAVSECFAQWQDLVTVPGLPWYPAFAAFPLAMAPPMPNVPMPLITCVSGGLTFMSTPTMLKQKMVDALGDSKAQHHEELFLSIATGVSAAFLAWLPSQQVMNVLGKGPVPTYAPPYVPVGPVVAGDNLAIPGHLAA